METGKTLRAVNARTRRCLTRIQIKEKNPTGHVERRPVDFLSRGRFRRGSAAQCVERLCRPLHAVQVLTATRDQATVCRLAALFLDKAIRSDTAALSILIVREA